MMGSRAWTRTEPNVYYMLFVLWQAKQNKERIYSTQDDETLGQTETTRHCRGINTPQEQETASSCLPIMPVESPITLEFLLSRPVLLDLSWAASAFAKWVWRPTELKKWWNNSSHSTACGASWSAARRQMSVSDHLREETAWTIWQYYQVYQYFILLFNNGTSSV